MKKRMLLATLFWMSATGLAHAQQKELHVTYDFSYLTKWLSKGAEAYGQQGATFNTIDVDLYGTGFGVRVIHRNATSSGYVDKQRFDYQPYYKSRLFETEPYALNYSIAVGYEHYYGLDRAKANTTFEWIYAFSWPNLIPNGPVPRYIAHYEYPAGSGHVNRGVTGWVHRFGFDYDMKTSLLPQPLRVSSEIAYTDGLGGAAHDWSYANFGLSSKFKLTQNLTFIPAVYQQISMDKSVSRRKDITYAILSMRYKF